MAWEQKGKRRYLYRSVRRDGKVKKLYLGCGETAVKAEHEFAQTRAVRRADQAAAAALEASLEPLARQTAELASDIDTLVEAVLRVNGFHTHKGTWRRSRAQTKQAKAI